MITNKIKSIFLDIDGTLITNSKEITTFTQKVLKEVANRLNVKIVLISSRMPKSLEIICEKTGINKNFVAFNGSIIQILGEENLNIVECSNVINRDLVRKCLESISNLDRISFNVYTKNKWLSNSFDYWTNREVKSTFVVPDKCNLTIENLDDYLENEFCHKLMLRSTEEELNRSLRDIIDIDMQNSTYMVRPKPTLIEMTPKNVDKGGALILIMNRFNLSSEEVLVFGDAENDIGMFNIVKYSFAMANSIDCLKKVAWEVIGSNDEEGVALRLNSIFNLGFEK